MLGLNMQKAYLTAGISLSPLIHYHPEQKDFYADPPVLTKYESPNGIHSDYVMKEVFIFLLLTLEHDPDAQWAAEWFDRAFTYSYETNSIEWPLHDTLHNHRVSCSASRYSTE